MPAREYNNIIVMSLWNHASDNIKYVQIYANDFGFWVALRSKLNTIPNYIHLRMY